MKKYIDFDFIEFQKELLSKSPLNLIVNPHFPKFELFEADDERYGKVYGFDVNNSDHEGIALTLDRAIEEMKKEYVNTLRSDNNSLLSQKAKMLEEIFTKRYPDYWFYGTNDIELGVEINIRKMNTDEYDFIPEIWIFSNSSTAFRYLTNFMPFDMAMDIVQTMSRVCHSKMSLTYKGKELYCYENGVAV